MAAILNQPHFQDAEKAREYLEALRWPHGVVCPHCGVIGSATALTGNKNYRPGLYKCTACTDQFTVTVGTVFERSKIALNVWLQAVHLMCASKKGISAKQLERMLGVTYKTAWFMAHRIREAMKSESGSLLGGPGSSGIVEADETYWGNATDENDKPVAKPRGGFRHKMMIVSLVERDGNKRSIHVPNVNGQSLAAVLKSQVSEKARLMTDSAKYYRKVGKEFASHEYVDHGKKEYARGDVTTNTVECSFAILKRGLIGTFHSVSEKHLQRYCTEFDYRWNTRTTAGYSDTMRADALLAQIGGKRLTYRRTDCQPQALV
ncbi:IS1595 family transposase [Caenimonas aquaedulcis]|uniref:IS1595 family transposase n=1 Tax=Caenimonas aquaedulcis TaxID=2793270 RepID=A0A931H4J0_9BURK|nr:IS1595 family transposase [Caenimonas aquaedulcis]MBG9388358.1 IS1595 family transposase [Caenimonas aquaedulcis]